MNHQFTNEVIRDLNLPKMDMSDFVAIERKYKTLMLFNTSIFFSIVLLIGIGVFFLPDVELGYVYFAILIPSVLLFWGLLVGLNLKNFPQKSYLVRDKDISYKTGWLFRKVTTVSINRIQHVELRQSPLARLFGLSKLVIYTAGGSSSDISIPGLLPSKAEELKVYLTKKVSDTQEVEAMPKPEDHD